MVDITGEGVEGMTYKQTWISVPHMDAVMRRMKEASKRLPDMDYRTKAGKKGRELLRAMSKGTIGTYLAPMWSWVPVEGAAAMLAKACEVMGQDFFTIPKDRREPRMIMVLCPNCGSDGVVLIHHEEVRGNGDVKSVRECYRECGFGGYFHLENWG